MKWEVSHLNDMKLIFFFPLASCVSFSDIHNEGLKVYFGLNSFFHVVGCYSIVFYLIYQVSDLNI